MNYLAHFFLGADTPERLLGGLLADAAKGRLENLPYQGELLHGIWLHRCIDSFTDRHPQVAASRARFSPARRRFAGIAVDMAYDHFLARHWQLYATASLPAFSAHAYQVLARHESLLPERLRRLSQIMRHEDWLVSYQSLTYLGRSLDRISRRASHFSPLLGSVEEISNEYDGLEEDFLRFFPLLLTHVRNLEPPWLDAVSPASLWNADFARSARGDSMDRDKPKDMNPGDQAPPGTPGTGEDICPRCHGSGKLDGDQCENCGGTGYVVEGIGGA